MSSEKLAVGDFGDEVARLHENLKKHGFEVSEEELKRKFFGPTTRDAVRKLQSLHGLEVSGELNKETAAQLSFSVKDSATPSVFGAVGSTPELQSRKKSEKDRTRLQSSEITRESKQLVNINEITFPLKHEMQGPEIANLQEVLRLLLDNAIILPSSEVERRDLTAGLQQELSTQTYGRFTAITVSRFQSEQNLQSIGDVDKPTANALNLLLTKLKESDEKQPEYMVRGTVRFFDGFPALGIRVVAYDKDLRSEQELGKSETDNKGFYEIKYSFLQFLKKEKGSADLVIKAFGDREFLLATSPVLFNAPADAEIDLTIPAEVLEPPTLFEKIDKALIPLLEELKVADLEEDEQFQDISFLSGETGYEKDVLARFVLAYKLVEQGIQPEFWFVLLGGSFYQFSEDQSLKEQLAVVLDALLSLDVIAVNKAINRGFKQKEIPEAFQANVPSWVESFLKIIAARSLGEATRPTFTKLALEHAGIMDAKKKETFALLFNEHRALTPKLLEALEKDPLFKKEEISDLRASFQLAEMVQGDFSVVKAIKEGFTVRQPEQIRKLAKVSEEDWVKLIKIKHASGELKLPFETSEVAGQAKMPDAEAYGKMIGRQFKEAFPTTAFAGELERALQNGGVHGLHRAKDISKFLEQHETFELLNTPIDEFLENNINSSLRALAQDENFRLEIKAAQRVFKLAPTFEAIDALLADGLHSAQKIYNLGETEFMRRYANSPGFTAESARLAWNRAADTHAAVLTIVADLKALEADALPLALKNGNEALSTFPNWNNLFKSGDLCECEHCRSVLSPAAYFADLLMFLKDRKTADSTSTVKDVLFRRRPDLGYLELNCDNALTPYPYIDTVCEVLENVVAAGENDLELPGFTTMPADTNAAKADVAAAFAARQINLGSDFSISQVTSSDPDLWVVHGNDVTYLLKKKATPNFFAEILRNTKASADELRAYPQYINPKAYSKLKMAKYPLTLPFDLYAEEVRAAFQKTNLQRWDLMHALRGPSDPNDPTDGEIATEYFRISADADSPIDEKRLILVADPTVDGQKEIWGGIDADWLDELSNVKNFLQKTGLEYNELLTLIDLKFINPTGDVAILHKDPSCDTDKKEIKVLDAVKLDQIHRFLRLWRKLNDWKMWELDLVIRHPNIGNGAVDEAFLIDLFYISQLRKKLGKKTTVEQLCALFGNLNTETHFTKLHEKREDALYQSLFLNKRLIQPLDKAFEIDPENNEVKPVIDPNTGLQVIDPVTGLPKRHKLHDHHPVLLAALEIREADLLLLKGLTKASDGTTKYITDDITLANLSFLWRHAWLPKQLKYKIEDWKTVLKIFHMDLSNFDSPKAAWEFLEKIDHLKATGFTPDELNWLLAADRLAKASVKEADAARFLAALRKELQAVRAENDPVQYNFLMATPPNDVDSLTALLTTLLQKLNRDETTAQSFIATLRNDLKQEKAVAGLPAGFTFPQTITGTPNNIPIQYEPALYFGGTMTAAQRTVLLTDPSLAAITGLQAYQQAIEKLFEQPGLPVIVSLPTGFTFPATITDNIHIRYKPVLRFTGLMTDDQRTTLLNDSSLVAVIGIPAYKEAIEEFFIRPRLAMKFFEPVFTELLASLPETVNFKALPDTALALRVSYDAEQRLLNFNGIMSAEEKSALDALSADISYRNAVNSLFTQPLGTFPSEKTWMQNSDLLFPLRDTIDPTNDHLAENLATASKKALAYLSRTLSEGTVIQQSSAQLGLSEALTRQLLTHYALLPETLLAHFTDSFSATTGVVDYATLKKSFDGWFWVNRVATILKKWKITFAELEKIITLPSAAQLLNFGMLPPYNSPPTAVAPIDQFLRTSRLMRLRDRLPEPEITLLELMEKLNSGAYATAAASSPTATEQRLFAEDVQRLNDVWLAPDVESIITSTDIPYPGGYLLAETWERLRRIFYFLENLNASAEIVKAFASSALGDGHTTTLKELLRSKLGTETWLTLSAEIQDVLRERKRNALAAYLLSYPISGKWENTNDLYAYYLLDVEMSACQLTSRLVQASGSVQLFVQRCFMGLEPEVVVKADGADGDSAWRWWKWMRKYRLWEANRKVFLWPENWIEPELKKDRSQFFRDLENELLQNEVNQYTVETAFQNYLEKLDGVAQLEIAGFYQEDDGDNTIIHVFGRTPGAEPHLYYYRRYDYRQWTPWEKVELDIQGDYLIPAVVKKRLFLFWPEFTEVPFEEGNSTVRFPAINLGTESTVQVDRAKKTLRMRMQMSTHMPDKTGQSHWAPKKISKDFAESFWYFSSEYIKKHYQFFPIDMSGMGGSFGIQYDGFGINKNLQSGGYLFGAFNISGCKGVPELASHIGAFIHSIRPEVDSVDIWPVFMKWIELSSRQDKENDFTLINYIQSTLENLHQTQVLKQTPGIFKMTPPWHLSYLDRLLLDGLWAFGSGSSILAARAVVRNIPIGTWLPFFYNDRRRTFFVLPSFLGGGLGRNDSLTNIGGGIRSYYPEIKKIFRQLEDYFEGLVQTWLDKFDLTSLTADQRQQVEQLLQQQFPESMFPDAVSPPYTDEQIKHLIKRWIMRYAHYYLGTISFNLFQFRQFHFKNYYHPFVCDFAKMVYNPLQGIPTLMSRETQLKSTGFSFRQAYQPTEWVVEKATDDFYPEEDVDFSPDGAYSPYNWELFFHVPLLIANSLSKNQRFEEARDWYHFIFNPLGVESSTPGGSEMSKYWITKPFYETTDPKYIQQRIDNILRMLAGDTSVPDFSAQARADLENAVFDWRTNPFEPHRIANYRTVAYQKTVVMKYLDNLIAWGDYLFRQDSMESINEATQLYILAAEILGPRPKKIPHQAKIPLESFNELEDELDKFSNALVQLENLVPIQPGNGPEGADPAPLPTLYFCIPWNDKMLGYWDTVADRLYKIRHCMNIEGVVRQLALFEPPIDPAALVKAVAGGLDISSVLADLNAPLPLYRFNILLQKANEVCNDVKALGSALLSALEKKDAEELGLLRQGQEIELLKAVLAVREKQIEEAKENLASAKKSKELAQIRKQYYESREFMNGGETTALMLSFESANISLGIALEYALAGASKVVPQFSVGGAGAGGSPYATAETGGRTAGEIAQDAASVLSAISTTLDKYASFAGTIAGYQRRKDDWDHQKNLALREIEQADTSIAAAELRIAIAEKELENHNLQIENAKAVDEFMHSKYTNQELYQWQVGQISGVYFQSYKLAYDLAKQAERCFRFELGLQDSSYIKFGYWDSLKKGLLSGEKLQYDLRRLEAAYLEQNRREFELTKHISLILLDPLALVKLRETGKCFFNIPEEILDLDYPGHYFRRIKSVSITLPCVVGPYTTISCTLRLLKNSIRINTANGDNGYPRNTDDQGLPINDNRFLENNIPVKAIATSNAQNDSGVFELSFRDERYLPFEGAGIISEWSLELFTDLPSNSPDPTQPDFGKSLRQFDYSTISDAILHIKYTASEDAGAFKNAAVTHLRNYFSQEESTHSMRLFNLRQEFPTRWHRFLNPTDPTKGNVFELEMSPSLFPLRDEGKTLKVNTIWLLARCTDHGDYRMVMTPPLPSPPPDESDTLKLARVDQFGGLHFSQKDISVSEIEIAPTDTPIKWQLKMTRPGGGNLQEDPVKKIMEVEDMLLILGYEWEES